MHKGRQYPYCPQFWVGTAYFWPYFIPWKWRINAIEFFHGGLLAFVHAPFPLITAGAEVLDAQTVRYSLPITWSLVADLLTITGADDIHLMQKYVVWTFQLWKSGLEIDFAVWAASTPATGINPIFGFMYNVPYGTPTSANASVDMRQANYEDGGSPWS